MIVWVAPAYAGAWTKDLGEVYAKLGVDVFAAVRYVEPGGVPDPEDGYLGQQGSIYAEVGVVPGWKGQLVLSLPVVAGTHHAVYSDAFGEDEVRATTVRTGDLRLAAQVALHPALPLALAVDLKVPTYDNGRIGEAYPVYRLLFPKPGDGQIDVGAMLYAGASPWRGGFVEGGVGFVHRTESFVRWDPVALELTDGLRLAAKAGHQLGRFLPVVGAEGTISPSPTQYTRSAVSVSLSGLIDLTEALAIEPRFAADLWTRNSSQGVGGGIGLSLRR